MIEQKKADVYGCLLLTHENGEITPRLHWPNKGVETMFSGNSDDNMLPHSSVLLRAEVARKAGNYQERAVGLGADDYHLWYRMHQVGAQFFRDDEVRNVVYRIHEQNSLAIRRARFGDTQKKRKESLLRKAAAAAGIAVMAAPVAAGTVGCADDSAKQPEAKAPDARAEGATPGANPADPPHS
jgi:hypothetical protein